MKSASQIRVRLSACPSEVKVCLNNDFQMNVGVSLFLKNIYIYIYIVHRWIASSSSTNFEVFFFPKYKLVFQFF